MATNQPPSTKLPNRELILVTGKTGSGKTVLTRALLARRPRIIALDPIGEYPGEYFDDLQDMIDHVKENKIFAVKSKHRDDLDALCAIANGVFEKHHGGVTLVIEEAQAMAPQSSEHLSEDLANVLYRGRHFRTSCVFVAQRAATIHIAARSQWTKLYAFNQSEKADIQWLEGQTRIKAETFMALPPLHGYECTQWTHQKIRLDLTPASKYAKIVPLSDVVEVHTKEDDE